MLKMRGIPDESIDLIITSPPYNKHLSKRKCRENDTWKKSNISYGEFNDDMDEKDYQAWQKEVLDECLRVLKKDGSIFYNHKPRISNHRVIFPHEWLGGFIIRQMIIWNRKNSPSIDPIRFLPTTEYIFWITKEQKTPKFNRESLRYTEVWDIIAPPNSYHPAPFPEKLAENCILSTTDKNDVVLDPFMGSGTTGVACMNLNRKFIGIEISEAYMRIAEARIREVGKQCKLEVGGNL